MYVREKSHHKCEWKEKKKKRKGEKNPEGKDLSGEPRTPGPEAHCVFSNKHEGL